MPMNLTLAVAAFVMATSLVLLVSILLSGRQNRVDTRLKELMDNSGVAPKEEVISRLARRALPRLGTPLMPDDEQERTRLKTRLIHAGLYRSHHMALYFSAKVLLTIAPVLIGVLLGSFGIISMAFSVLYGVL